MRIFSACCADGDGRYLIDSVAWVGPCSMVASGLWFDSDSSSEGDDAFSLGITWASWSGSEDAAPQGLQVKQTSFMPLVSCRV